MIFCGLGVVLCVVWELCGCGLYVIVCVVVCLCYCVRRNGSCLCDVVRGLRRLVLRVVGCGECIGFERVCGYLCGCVWFCVICVYFWVEIVVMDVCDFVGFCDVVFECVGGFDCYCGYLCNFLVGYWYCMLCV